jgi:hypothetical protein
MDNNDFLLIVVAALVFNAFILFIVIRWATRADKRTMYEWAQMELLAKIARAQGVPEVEIKAIAGAIK